MAPPTVRWLRSAKTRLHHCQSEEEEEAAAVAQVSGLAKEPVSALGLVLGLAPAWALAQALAKETALEPESAQATDLRVTARSLNCRRTQRALLMQLQ
jgi:hypothetical protein